MGFVYRELTDEEKNHIASFKIRNVMGGGISWIPDKAVVDEERKIYYYQFDGQGWRNGADGAPPCWYSFIWGDDVFRVTVYWSEKKLEGGEIHIAYRVTTILTPEKYREREEEVMEAIRDAMIMEAKRRGRYVIEFLKMPEPNYQSYDISQTKSFE